MLVKRCTGAPREKSSLLRTSSPDSACCSDHESSPTSSSCSSSSTGPGIQNQTLSFLSSTSTGPGKQDQTLPLLSPRRRSGLVGGRHQTTNKKCTIDSDCDSGIVSVRRDSSSRVGSTSSTDTDTGQEVTYLKISLQPLSVVPDQPSPKKKSVHGHCEDYLSEENVRSSCRKLLATLYSRRNLVQNPSLTSPQCAPPVVRRNLSCDCLQPSQSKKSHRLSLQQPPYQAKDMIQVYARPATVIPDLPVQSSTLPRNQSSWKQVPKRHCHQQTGQDIKTPVPDPHSDRASNFGQNGLKPVRDHQSDRTPSFGQNRTTPVRDHPPDRASSFGQIGLKPVPDPRSDRASSFGQNGPTPVRNPSSDRTFSLGQNGPTPVSDPSSDRSCSFGQNGPIAVRDPGSDRSCSFGQNGPTALRVRHHDRRSHHPGITAAENSLGIRTKPTSRLSWDPDTNLGGDVTHHLVSDGSGAQVEYAVVDKTKKRRHKLLGAEHVTSQPCLNVTPEGHPKNNMHKSDLTLYRGPGSTSSDSSTTKRTLLERVQGLSKSARTVLRKAFSTERVYRPHKQEQHDEEAAKSTSLVSGIKTRISSRNATKKNTALQNLQALRIESGRNPMWDDMDQVNSPTGLEQTWGQLLQLNVDGSQVIELSRPPGKPFGFFVARGRVKETKGVFVSRMQDEVTRQHLAGLLDVGDEILEIEAVDVRGSDILEVNALMARKRTLLLTVLPYICRKDI